jgi:hypothetical protein
MATRTTGLIGGLQQDDKTVLIDLTEKTAKAKVVREGYQVPPAALDKNKAQFEFDNYEITPSKALPRVVAQSVPAGTRVTGGTVVDLVLVPRSGVRFDIFEGVHSDFKGKNVEFMTEGMLEDSKARQIFLSYENAGDVPAADKSFLQSQFIERGITFDENKADKNFQAAYNTARGALAFK